MPLLYGLVDSTIKYFEYSSVYIYISTHSYVLSSDLSTTLKHLGCLFSNRWRIITIWYIYFQKKYAKSPFTNLLKPSRTNYLDTTQCAQRDTDQNENNTNYSEKWTIYLFTNEPGRDCGKSKRQGVAYGTSQRDVGGPKQIVVHHWAALV